MKSAFASSFFNENLNDWDTQNVTTMECMFKDAIYFDSSIDKWNTSKVSNMNEMFNNARAFNQ